MLKTRRFEVSVGLSYALLLVALAVPAIALGHAFKAAESRDHVVAKATEAVLKVVRLQAAAGRIAAAARAYLLTGDPAQLAVASQTEELVAGVKDLHDDVHYSAEEEILDRIVVAVADYDDCLARVFAGRAAGGAPSAQLVSLFEDKMLPRQRVIADELGDYIANREATVGPLAAAAEAAFSHALIVSFAAVLLALLVSATLGLSSSRRLVMLYKTAQSASQLATGALAARDELLGVVAHDLRSPLSAIALKAAMIRRSAESERTWQQSQSIESIALRTERLIRTLLDTAVMEEGHFNVTPAPTRTQEIVGEVRELFGTQAAALSITLTVGVDEPDGLVWADRGRIVQVIGNLVENALKFTPVDGEVAVAVETLVSEVRVTVRDSGCGIAAEDLAHVFDRFWKAANGRTRGQGLGLYIARGIVEAHGGRIWVESSPQGSAFMFTLRRYTQ